MIPVNEGFDKEVGTIRQVNIDSEMQASYLDYAMSVIVARALPDVRDGLKPVHRRILYAMHDLGLTSDKSYKKSARIVGEVLGKYHPHGDAAVYEAMVRMAQDFSLRCPLVDGQGNFGSVDGDNAAAMRYTEARLATISNEMLNDIDKDTVDWVDNFDGTLKEPSVLPAALPNLLVNGASGIAVGMSTNIPPHNLGEICDAITFLIDNHHRVDDVTLEDLMAMVQGPDFPTGGLVYRYRHEGNGEAQEQVDVIAMAYASGRGRIVMQAKAHFEDMSRNRSRIVVTELPYQTNKTNLLERIADLVRDGRLEGITDLRDESDRTGMRICIELTRNVEPRSVLAELYKQTPLQSTFGVSLLALVDGEPRYLSLKRMLQYYIEHRQNVIIRRSEHDLAKALKRAHILEGLLRALDVLDEVIATIRKSRTAETARNNLISEFKFTELQAQAILDMQLRRLAALERRKLSDEYDEITKLIRELQDLLGSPEKVLLLIKHEVLALKEKYGDARRTQIADRVKGTLTAMDVLPDQDVWITLSNDGTIARQNVEPPTVSRLTKLAKNAGRALLVANTRQDLYLITEKGKSSRVPIHQIPESGAHFADVSGLTRRDRIVAIHPIAKPNGDDAVAGYLVMGTLQGQVKRVALADLVSQAHAEPTVINLDAGDELVFADVGVSSGEIVLVAAGGQAIRFNDETVRPMGLNAGGIGGIKLDRKDRVVAGQWFDPVKQADYAVAIVTAFGLGKRTPLADFPIQGRNGKGVVAAKISPRGGEIAGAALLLPTDYLINITYRGVPKVLQGASVPEMGRSAQGKPVVSLASGDHIWQVFAVTGGSELDPTELQSTSGPRTGASQSKTTREGPSTSSKTAAKNQDHAASPKAQHRSPPTARPKGSPRASQKPATGTNRASKAVGNAQSSAGDEKTTLAPIGGKPKSDTAVQRPTGRDQPTRAAPGGKPPRSIDKSALPQPEQLVFRPPPTVDSAPAKPSLRTKGKRDETRDKETTAKRSNSSQPSGDRRRAKGPRSYPRPSDPGQMMLIPPSDPPDT